MKVVVDKAPGAKGGKEQSAQPEQLGRAAIAARAATFPLILMSFCGAAKTV